MGLTTRRCLWLPSYRFSWG